MSSKLSLIINREYTTRVRKKSFIIMSLLMPVGMLLLMALPTLIAMVGQTEASKIAVIDRTQRYGQALTDDSSATYSLLAADTDEDSLRSAYEAGGFDAYMVIGGRPDGKDSVRLYSQSTLPMETVRHTEDDLREALRREMMDNYEGHSAGLDSLFERVNDATARVTTISIAEDGSESEDSAAVGAVVAMVAAMLIYMFVITTGSMVMQGVMEEKTNRIVEVLVSSVRPFELMMGKIIGIALVALTQLAIWIVLGVALMACAASIFAPEAAAVASSVAADPSVADPGMVSEIMAKLQAVNFVQIISLFVVYFLFGYLLYASLFAICGAAMDSPQDGSQLTLIVMIPLFAAIYIAIHTMQDPSSQLSFWSSLFPFTSPIIMMARLPFGVPAWEIALSLVLLIGTFVLFTWIAARIYRVGILMYGKKVTFGEIIKWFRQSE
mgnify:FL=1